jgi:glycerophosphoryl diester phosphodiesterase
MVSARMLRTPDAAALAKVSEYCTAVAVGKAACIAEDSQAWIREAAALGLQVIAWTFDDAKSDATRFGSSQAEMECAFRNGVSAVFTDFPATGGKARSAVCPR